MPDVGPAAECVGSALGAAIGRGTGIGLTESMRDVNRPDEVKASGGMLTVSGAHEGGRLVLSFDGPVVGGALPRSTDGGCEHFDTLNLYTPSPSTTRGLLGTLAVSDGGVAADGGQLTRLSLSGMSLEGDGGTPLADREFLLVLP